MRVFPTTFSRISISTPAFKARNSALNRAATAWSCRYDEQESKECSACPCKTLEQQNSLLGLDEFAESIQVLELFLISELLIGHYQLLIELSLSLYLFSKFLLNLS